MKMANGNDLRLILYTLINSSFGDLLALSGVLCSTWVSINAGTSARDWLLPMGNTAHQSVKASNLMVARPGGLRKQQ